MIENLLSSIPPRTRTSFYRTSAGAEIDLLLELPGRRGLWAIEVKHGLSAKPRKGFHNAREDLKPDRSFGVHSGEDRYPVAAHIEAVGLKAMVKLLAHRQ